MLEGKRILDSQTQDSPRLSKTPKSPCERLVTMQSHKLQSIKHQFATAPDLEHYLELLTKMKDALDDKTLERRVQNIMGALAYCAENLGVRERRLTAARMENQRITSRVRSLQEARNLEARNIQVFWWHESFHGPGQ